MPHSSSAGVPRSLVLFMAAVNGAIVANIYYSQPLLAEIARDLHLGESQAGCITALTQAGYGFGLLFLTPLGDMAERRRLIVILTLMAGSALALTGSLHSAPLFLLMNFIIGLLSVVPQIIVPFIATLSGSAERGRNVGTVMSGLLLGILLARTVSGFIGAHLGWRAAYFCAALSMILLAALIRLLMPVSRPVNVLNYSELLASLPGFLKKVPVLKEASLSGALLFASFSVFWTTLVFHLESLPSHLGAQAAGCFGLVGAAGAIAASMSGRLADRLGAYRIVAAGTALILLAWIVMAIGGSSLVVLAGGAALLDLGVQGAHVANQTRVLSHMPEARSRINTIYIVSFFAGGALGSLAGSFIWILAGWRGVCLLGGTLMGLALLAGYILSNRGEAGLLQEN